MAPLVQAQADNIAAWTLRDKASISVRTGQQLQLGGDEWNHVAQARFRSKRSSADRPAMRVQQGFDAVS